MTVAAAHRPGSSRRKAAVALVALGEERATAVLRGLDPSTVRELVGEIARLGPVRTDEARAALEELSAGLRADAHLPAPTAQYAEALLRGALGDVDPDAAAMPTVIINRTAARALGFSDPNAAIGKQLRWGRWRRGDDHSKGPPALSPSRIVGVVADAPNSMRIAADPTFYVVHPHDSDLREMHEEKAKGKPAELYQIVDSALN